MYTMAYDIEIGGWHVGMLDSVEVHRSVELLADTATITLPGAQYNVALDVEDKLHRGDKVIIRFGYKEEGLRRSSLAGCNKSVQMVAILS